jgi:hypothetical protein
VLVHTVDVPFDGPQTLAFRAPGTRFEALRAALRAAFERGDGGPLRESWRASIDGYRAARANAAWRVPRATLLELVDELRRACARAERDAPVEGGLYDAAPSDLEALRAACDRVERLARAADHLDLAPERWIPFVSKARHRVRPYASGVGGRRPLNYEWGSYAFALAELDQPGRDRGPTGECGAPDDGPAPGALERLRSVRYFLEDYDHETGESRRGAEVSARAIENVTRDPVVLADGTETTAYDAWDDARAATRLDDRLELLVGPFVASRGPGPFRGAPESARPVVDPSWELLEIFRAGHDPHVRWAPPPWWFLAGEDLDRELDELKTAEPSRAWFARLGDEYYLEQWGAPMPPDWHDWAAVLSDCWPRCRDRYAALLDDARRAGDVVLLTYWVPDDQGTITSPLDDASGALV